MARGPKKHLKRLNAPSHWMLDKLGGVWAPRPSTGPHKLRECLPAMILLRNRLKYALTKKECSLIMMQRLVQIDGKVRTDTTYPAGFMDVVSIPKVKSHWRLLLDTKGRFTTVPVAAQESSFKLCKVKRQQLGNKGVPYIATHDARTIRFPNPDIKVNDTVKIDIATGKVLDFVKFEVGNVCMLTGGKNAGRVGIIERRERHPGSYEIIHIKDATGNEFSTRIDNVFVVGSGGKPLITLPKGKGIRKTILEEREMALNSK